jgi:glycosyltransferase involved in cell wall biosynthesis
MSLRISLVIPVRDEEGALPALIASIEKQTLAPAEVIIVDGGSRDRTLAIAREYATRDSRYKVIDAGDATPGRGRNIGFRAATCEWIAFTDSGMVLEPDWLQQLATAESTGASVVYGNYEPVTDTFFTRCAALAFIEPKVARDGRLMRGPSIPSSLMKRSVLEDVGGFPDLRNGEDILLIQKIAEAGNAPGWAHRATIWWSLQPDLASTFRRFRTYSRNSVYAKMLHQWHYGVLRIYVAMVSPVVLAYFTKSWWLLAVPPALHVLRTAKSIWIRGESKRVSALMNPFVFGTVAAILLLLDAALFTGWAEAIFGLKRPKVGEQNATAHAAGASR